jgi:hypothetical protein
MKGTFRQQLQVQPASYFTVITRPKARGHWTIASNHLATTGANMQPNLITLWPGEFRIQDLSHQLATRQGSVTGNVAVLSQPSRREG